MKATILVVAMMMLAGCGPSEREKEAAAAADAAAKIEAMKKVEIAAYYQAKSRLSADKPGAPPSEAVDYQRACEDLDRAIASATAAGVGLGTISSFRSAGTDAGTKDWQKFEAEMRAIRGGKD
jgi:hypothetical protein